MHAITGNENLDEICLETRIVKLQHVNLFSGGFLNIWPKCVVAAAAATRPFKTELVGHWGESNLAAAHQTTAAVFEPQRKKEKKLYCGLHEN